MQKQFTIRGASFTLSKKDIIDSIRGRRPESVRHYYVEIGGSAYPIKQVLGKALTHKNISRFRADFTSQCAISVLRSLGFEIKRG